MKKVLILMSLFFAVSALYAQKPAKAAASSGAASTRPISGFTLGEYKECVRFCVAQFPQGGADRTTCINGCGSQAAAKPTETPEVPKEAAKPTKTSTKAKQ